MELKICLKYDHVLNRRTEMNNFGSSILNEVNIKK